MNDFESYLFSARQEIEYENYLLEVNREERKRKRTENTIRIITLILISIACFCCIYGSLKSKNTEIEDIAEQFDDESLPGDNIAASGYASIELLKAEVIYEEPGITYNHSATFKVTHYCGCSICCGKWSSGSEDKAVGASGTNLKAYQSLAVDPKIIPLGTILYDHTGKQYIAEDTGSAIKGYKVDLFTGNHQEALNLGIKEIELYW